MEVSYLEMGHFQEANHILFVGYFFAINQSAVFMNSYMSELALRIESLYFMALFWFCMPQEEGGEISLIYIWIR